MEFNELKECLTQQEEINELEFIKCAELAQNSTFQSLVDSCKNLGYLNLLNKEPR